MECKHKLGYCIVCGDVDGRLVGVIQGNELSETANDRGAAKRFGNMVASSVHLK